MADVRSAPVPTIAATAVAADVKRGLGEFMSADASASGFVDLVMSRPAKIEFGDDEKRSFVTNEQVERTTTEAAPADALKTKIKERVREVMSNDKTEVKDKRAQKLLKKIAAFLIKADEKGEIKLPKDLSAKLKEVLAKDPETMPAGELALAMNDLIATFKTLKIDFSQPTGKTQATWPPELIDGFKEIGIHAGVDAGTVVTTLDALRTLKDLVNCSETNALNTLNEKKQALLEAIDPHHVLFGVGQEEIATDVNAEVKADVTATATVEVKTADNKEDTVTAVKAAAQNTMTNILIEATADTTTKSTDKTTAAAPAAELSAVKTEKENRAARAQTLAAQFADLKMMDTDKTVPTAETAKTLAGAAIATEKSAPAAADKLEKAFAKAEAKGQAPVVQAPVISPAPAARAEAAAQIINTAAVKSVEALSAITNAPATNHTGIANHVTNELNPLNRLNASTTANTLAATRLPPSPAAQQVVVQIQQKLNKDTQLSLQLTPVELGRVEVRVTVARDGVASAVVTVDRPETLTLLQKDAAHLERALQQAGLNANQENMSFNLREQRQANQGFGQRSKRSLTDDGEDMKIKEATLQVMADGGIMSDNRINYHA